MKKQTQKTPTVPFLRAPRCTRSCLFTVPLFAALGGISPRIGSSAAEQYDANHWVACWAAAPQHPVKRGVQVFREQTLRLIVHPSTAGKTVRIKISNVFDNQPLVIGSAHIARRDGGPNIDAATDRTLTFGKQSSTTIHADSLAVSGRLKPTWVQVVPMLERCNTYRSAS